MCGIVGYIGTTACKEPLLKGLARLEYRGYDSAGIAVLSPDDATLQVVHAVGELAHLKKRLEDFTSEGTIGIGHIRWATHGEPSLLNCHPQVDCNASIALAHNGIIENFTDLRRELEQEHTFCSVTDTETVVHLLESLLLQHSSLQQALVACVAQLEGAYALALLLRAYPDTLIAVRKRSSVYLGIGQDKSYLASDQRAFAGDVQQMIMMPDESFALIRKNEVQLFNFAGESLPLTYRPVAPHDGEITSEGFAHFMLKEIFEQRAVIHRTLKKYYHAGERLLDQMGLQPDQVARFSCLHIIACGTSWHAGLLAKFFFEEVAGLKTEVHIASEFRYAQFWPDPHGLYCAISQSGETTDTLEAIRMVKQAGGHTVALTNIAVSTMVDECDGHLEIFAGPEIAVASTKAFSAQVVALYLLAHVVGIRRGVLKADALEQASHDLIIAAHALEQGLEFYRNEIIEVIAPRYKTYQKMLFVGRQESYVTAQEAALKLKEISYIFADALPAGELKHGSLALVDQETPVILFSSLRPLMYQKLLSTAQEIKARPSHLMVVAFEGQPELIKLADHAFIVPRVAPLLGPLAQIGLMQYCAYEIALQLGRPIDKPRNLAKSVTVE